MSDKTPELETELAAPAPLEFGKPALDIDRKQFSSRIRRLDDNRAELLRWIKNSLVEGIDFGRFHMYSKKTKTKCERGDSCPIAWHWSKPALMKPGAEKICALLGLTPRFPDLELVVEQIAHGRRLDSIALRCHLYDRLGHIVGEGMGGRDLRQDNGLNKSLKMAKKSALIDAVLVTAGLSELFTQDFGDGDDDPPETRDAVELVERVPYGPHKGRAWAEVPDQYLEDLRIHPDVDDDTKAIAKRELERRSAEDEHISEDPGRETVEAPRDMTLSEAGAALLGAPTEEELERVWSEIPERFRVPLKRQRERLLEALRQ